MSKHGEALWNEHGNLHGRTPRQVRRFPPITLFEDGDPFSKKQTISHLSISSVLSSGCGEICTKVILATNVRVAGEKVPTADPAWKLLLDSLDALAGPFRDRQLYFDSAEGDLFTNADGEQHTVCYGCRSWNSEEIYNYCRCDRSNSGNAFANLHRDATWRNFMFTKIAFIARMAEPLHPMMMARWFTGFTIRIDLIHDLDCHGVSAIVAGSVTRLLIRRADLGPSQASRLQFLNQYRFEYYSRTSETCRMPPLSVQNLNSGENFTESFATLSGPGIKAVASG